MTTIEKSILDNSMTYAEYVSIAEGLVKSGHTSTTGFTNSPKILAYAADNIARMKRLDASVELTSETLKKLSKITKPIILLDITEGWCGDASQVCPVLEKVAEAQPLITHRVVFRDEHLDIIDAFLTNGGRSIPKIVALDADGNVLGSWGPRPQALQDIVQANKKAMEQMPKEARKAQFEVVKALVHNWYDADKTVETQRELSDFLLSS